MPAADIDSLRSWARDVLLCKMWNKVRETQVNRTGPSCWEINRGSWGRKAGKHRSAHESDFSCLPRSPNSTADPDCLTHWVEVLPLASKFQFHGLGIQTHGLGAYDLGAWAVAWLCDRAGPDVLIESFYPRLEELGWEGAFRESFGLGPEAFYAEFDAFLELEIEEQVRILP